jgi:dTDP-4-amino-4,6-dideoxygalactose transaminase
MPLFRYDKIHASLGIEMFKQLDKITAHRKKTGLLLKTKLKELPGIFIPESNQNSEGVFLRLPVLVDESLRDKLITALNRKGIGATASYPKSLMEVPEVIKNCNVGNSSSANGIIISKELITLPTHQFVSKKHINIIYNTFKQYLN